MVNLLLQENSVLIEQIGSLKRIIQDGGKGRKSLSGFDRNRVKFGKDSMSDIQNESYPISRCSIEENEREDNLRLTYSI